MTQDVARLREALERLGKPEQLPQTYTSLPLDPTEPGVRKNPDGTTFEQHYYRYIVGQDDVDFIAAALAEPVTPVFVPVGQERAYDTGQRNSWDSQPAPSERSDDSRQAQLPEKLRGCDELAPEEIEELRESPELVHLYDAHRIVSLLLRVR